MFLRNLPLPVASLALAALLMPAAASAQVRGVGGKLPICNAGPSQVVECTGAVTAVQLDGTGSINPVPGALTYHWEHCPNPNVTLDDDTSPTPTAYVDLTGGCQLVCNVTLIVRNQFGPSSCMTTLTVHDTTPPLLSCPPDVTVGATDPTDPAHTGTATATDVCNPNPLVTYADDLSKPRIIARTWTADDSCQTSSCVQTITIESPPKTGPHLDIKPGSCPNPINVHDPAGALVNIPMALVGNDFDITSVDIDGLAVERTNFLVGSGSVPPYQIGVSDTATPFEGDLCGCHALLGDGVPDLSLHFDHLQVVQVLALDTEPDGAVIELKVTGHLLDGSPFEAHDCVRIINTGG